MAFISLYNFAKDIPVFLSSSFISIPSFLAKFSSLFPLSGLNSYSQANLPSLNNAESIFERSVLNVNINFVFEKSPISPSYIFKISERLSYDNKLISSLDFISLSQSSITRTRFCAAFLITYCLNSPV